MRIELHLRIDVSDDQRSTFLNFLREAISYYELPAGIRIRLLRDRDSPTHYVEVVEYDDSASYALDAHRVDHDPTMRDLLARWRTILSTAPVVETYEDLTFTIRDAERP